MSTDIPICNMCARLSKERETQIVYFIIYVAFLDIVNDRGASVFAHIACEDFLSLKSHDLLNIPTNDFRY